MSTNHECQFCSAPLEAEASFCEACGQPVPDQKTPAPEVPRSFIETPEFDEAEPAAATYPARPDHLEEAPPAVQPVTRSPSPGTNQNNCLRIVLVIALILVLICCCCLVLNVALVTSFNIDSIMGVFRAGAWCA